MNQKKNLLKNPSKKLLISFKNIDLIYGIVQDKAALYNSTHSSIIEDVLLKEFMPDSKAATHYVKMIYERGLKETFIALMQNLSAGVNLEASQSNAYELVRFAMNVVSRPFSASIDPAYKDLLAGHFPSNCEVLRDKIEYEASKRDVSFESDLRLKGDIMLLSLKGEPDFVPYNYFELVLAHWDILGNFTYTFRLLYDVVALSDPILWDRPEHRLAAIDCITKVTSLWDIY